MGHSNNIYYCDHCKKIMNSIEEVIFVEQIRYRAFCGEKCIIDFFTPLIKHFEKEESEFRKEFNLLDAKDNSIKDHEKIMELTLASPDELWVYGQDLSEEIWYYIKKFEDLNQSVMIVASLVFEGHPSFILLETITKSERLVEFYRRGRKVTDAKIHNTGQDLINRQGVVESEVTSNGENLDSISEKGLDPQLNEFIERKKKYFLTQLLEDRKESDISFESFYQYDQFLHEALERPDEVYMQEFTEGENQVPYYIYFRSFEQEGSSFFYVVICLHYATDHDSMEETLIPIISFPSRDPNLYMKYKKGKRVEGQAVS